MSIRDKVVDTVGRNVILGLFEEYARSDAKFKPLYNLKDTKKLFIETRDPTEYKIAMLLVGDWTHWLELRNHPSLKPIIDGWASEMEQMLRSEAIEEMIRLSKQPGGMAAAKWLHDKAYKSEKVGKGRPATKNENANSTSHVEEKLAGVIHLVRK